jgi:hypothetical protein
MNKNSLMLFVEDNEINDYNGIIEIDIKDVKDIDLIGYFNRIKLELNKRGINLNEI